MAAPFAGPPFVLEGPLPVPPPHRLVDVATILDEPDPHWANGGTVWSYPAGVPTGHDPCSSGTFRDKVDADDTPLPDFGPFTAYLPFACTPRSLNDEDEFKRRVTATFNATESFPVEEQLVGGEYQDLNPYLADSNLDILSLSTLTPVEAIALLEDAIAATGRAGAIHATPAAITALSSEVLVIPRANALWTPRGTRYVVGDGYVGAVPDSQGTVVAEGTAWLFATGPVYIYRGEVIVNPETLKEAMDRSTNLITFYAERDYVVYWDTALQAGVLMETTGCCAST